MQIDRAGLEAWQRDQPLSILQLDPADRAVLRVAGLSNFFMVNLSWVDMKFAVVNHVLRYGRLRQFWSGIL